MLGILEATEIKFSELKDVIDYRIESEYFENKFLEIDRKFSKIQNVHFSKIAKFENGRPYSSDSFNFDDGIPVSKIGDVTNKRDVKEWEFVKEDEFKKQKGKFLVNGDILMTLTGDPPDVGKVNYIFDAKKSTWNQRVAKIQLLKKQKYFLNNEVFYIVLSTETVRMQLERYAKGIRQRNLGNESLDRLLLPILTDPFQNKIAEMVKSAHKKLEQSKLLYKQYVFYLHSGSFDNYKIM